jgi:hypothetical protein
LVFFTINLYNFILCILNNFLKTYLKIITEVFTCHNPIFDHFILIIIIIILFTEKDKKNDDKKIMMIKKQVK